jgi:tRNA (adenine57-N1/adenine58-N1)-methyltransferase
VLAHYVKPTGCVYSYEIRPEFKNRAEKNILRTGLTKWVVLKTRDITLGIEETDVDSVVLDMATPWLVTENAYNALKGSGCLVSFSPTIEQVIQSVEALEKSGFVNVETVESIVRKIKVKKGETRPETLMIGHTGYLTHARKAEKSEK